MKTKLLKVLTLLTIFIFSALLCVACAPKQFEGISLNNVTVTYSQSGHNVTIVGAEKYPNATFSLSEDRFDAGVYTQTLTVTQSGYEDFTTTATLTINKANPENLLPQCENGSLINTTLKVVYTGAPITVTAFTNYEQRPYATVEYYQGETKLNSAPTNAGTYTDKLYVPETTNYNAYTKVYGLEIVEPQYTATFKILNPLTNELEDLTEDAPSVIPVSRNNEFIVPTEFDVTNKFNGYTFIGWYVDNEPIHTVYDYNKNVTVVAKYEVDFSNLTINCLGDSLTAGILPNYQIMEKPYPALLQEVLGVKKVNNYGVGGRFLSLDYPDTMCNVYSTMVDADIISVMGGTNDVLSFGTAKGVLGTLNDTDKSTIYGALDCLCRGLKEKYPNSYIFFMTPFALADIRDIDCLNNSGFSLNDVNTAIKIVCTRYNIDVFDVYNECDFKAQANYETSLGIGDGIHPNQQFINLFTSKLAQFIKDNYNK
ncbi:MAG: hypothetical protein J6R88_04005 [Clostridia bacterium]|nr:hypothetical protein [Clostridia bacterium]